MHSVTDRQTDRQTDSRMIPIADHTVYQYDRLKILWEGGIVGRGMLPSHTPPLRLESLDTCSFRSTRTLINYSEICASGLV